MAKIDTGLLIGAVIGILALSGKGFAAVVSNTGSGSILSGRLYPSDIAVFAQNAGFQDPDLVTAVAVAIAESSGDPHALGDTRIAHGPSYGLWQINAYWHPEYGPDFTVLYDPQTNANAAYSIYSAAGRSFSPWSTYKQGSYLSFVPTVQSALGGA